MAGASATTYYDVVTRYNVQNLGTGELNRYEREMRRANRAQDAMHGGVMRSRRAFKMLLVAMGPLTGGVIGVAAFGFAAAKSFSNLNQEMNSTIQLAAQLNTTMKYDQDPAKNFLISMKVARGTFQDLIKDAAALPGELTDFLGIGRAIAGPALKASGSPDIFREMIGKIALIAPSTGVGFDDAGRSAMMMLQGAVTNKSSLWKYLNTGGLMTEDGSPMKVGEYNALTLIERFTLLDQAMSKVVDNPLFRKAILHTWDTQMGTLADTLFGSSGIGGQLFKGKFDSMLDSLEEFNVTLEDNAPSIVSNLRMFGEGLTDLSAVIGGNTLFKVIGYPIGGIGMAIGDAVGGAAWMARHKRWQDEFDETADRGSLILRPYGTKGVHARFDYPADYDEKRDAYIAKRELEYFIHTYAEPFAGEMGHIASGTSPLIYAAKKFFEDPETLESLEAPKVEQIFNIRMDISTDESPRAVAVRLERAIGEQLAHPTTSARAHGMLTPSASAISGS